MTLHEYQLTATEAVNQISLAQEILAAAKRVARNVARGDLNNGIESPDEEREILRARLRRAATHVRVAEALVPQSAPIQIRLRPRNN